jgi:hypothetical protein
MSNNVSVSAFIYMEDRDKGLVIEKEMRQFHASLAQYVIICFNQVAGWKEKLSAYYLNTTLT